MRTSDRVESAVRAILIALLVAAVPAAVWLAVSTAADLRAHDSAMPVYSVQATVDADASDVHVPFNDISVPVHWSMNGLTYSGMARNGLARRNDQIALMVRPDGSLVSPQGDGDEILTRASGVAGMVLGCTALGVAALWRATSEVLGVRRRAQWARDWETAAPRRRNRQ